jgi:hypothetical protein
LVFDLKFQFIEMKNKFIVLNILAIVVFLIMCSYSSGPGSHGYDCTGAETGLQNPKGCTNCHGTLPSAGTNVSLELDSAGFSVDHYSPGMVYTVKLKGVNNSGATLPKFGFQISCIKGTNAMVTPINAGTWTAPFPSGTHHQPPSSGNFVASIVEHTLPQSASSGSGSTGSTYEKSISWTAPLAGTGSVSFWAAMNLVNGNGGSDTQDKWNTAQLHIQERQDQTALAKISEDIHIGVFPNPARDQFSLNLHGLKPGNYTLTVYDLNGSIIADQSVEGGSDQTMDISMWNQGCYKAVVRNDHFVKVISLLKL